MVRTRIDNVSRAVMVTRVVSVPRAVTKAIERLDVHTNAMTFSDTRGAGNDLDLDRNHFTILQRRMVRLEMRVLGRVFG